jgi:serine/threonine protein kinase
VSAAVSNTVTHRPTTKREAAGAAGTSAVDLARFQRSIVEIGLIEAVELERFVVTPDEVSRLAGALVRAGRLTAYQAAALTQGKTKGLLIGDYLSVDKLGQGGMGVVFKARHRPTDQVVALKILPPSFGRDREAVERFRREVVIATKLDHPNVVAAFDANEVQGVHFLAMEYISGCDLDRMVTDGGPLPVDIALHCTIQAARGLAAAHAQGIIHRDVKPANMMLDDKGSVRVLDLGLARVVEAGNLIGGSPAGSLTQSGAYMGTVDFMAPEQADDPRRVDHRADIYSLGCTLYFLVTGRPPFLADTVLKRLMAHQERPAPSLRAARPEASQKLEAAYLLMMAKRSAERPESMAAVIDLLEACRLPADNEDEARAGLTKIARRAFKRALPRGRDRGPDASIFARGPQTAGVHFDPDLRLEDVVMDLRPEFRPEPLSEDKLPPIVSRPLPKRIRRRRSSVPYSLLGFTLIGLAAAGYASRPQSKEVGRDPAQHETATSPTADESSPASPTLGDFVMKADPVVGWRPTLVASRRPTAPVADGLIGPSEYGPAVEVDFSEVSRFGALAAGIGNPALSKTPADLSVRLQAACSDRSLFLAFSVRDQFIDTPAADQPNPHLNDCVEVFLDGDHALNDFNPNNESTTGSREGFQLLTGAAGHQQTVSADFTNSDWKAATERTRDGYVVELEIPLSLIDTQDGPGTIPARPGSLIHFGMAIDDYDENVDRQRSFAYLRTGNNVLSPFQGRERSWTMGIKLEGTDRQPDAVAGHSAGKTRDTGGPPMLGKSNSATPATKPTRSDAGAPIAAILPGRVPPAGPARRGRPVPGGSWKIEGDQLVKIDAAFGFVSFGDQSWTDYDFSFEASKIAGRGYFVALFRANGGKQYLLDVGDAGEKVRLVAEKASGDGWSRSVLHSKPRAIRQREWCSVKISLRGPRIRVEVDGQALFIVVDDLNLQGGVQLRGESCAVRFRNIKVMTPEGATLWEGPPDLP